jgi:hypothetical protein
MSEKKTRGYIGYWVAGVWTVLVILFPASWIGAGCEEVGGFNSAVSCSQYGGGLDLLVRVGLIAAGWGLAKLQDPKP